MKDPHLAEKQTAHLVKAYEAIAAKMLKHIESDDGTDITISDEWKKFVEEASRSYLRSPKFQGFIKQVIETHLNEMVESVIAEDLETLAVEIVERTKKTLHETLEERVRAAVEQEMKKAVDKVKASFFK